MEIKTETEFSIGDNVIYKAPKEPPIQCLVTGVSISYSKPDYLEKPCVFYDIEWGKMPNQQKRHVYHFYIFKKKKCVDCPYNKH